MNKFNEDLNPGKLKILFIGSASSSHTHSWIDLLEDTEINIRLFAIPQSGYPPDEWKTKTYLTNEYIREGLDPNTRCCLFITPEEIQLLKEWVRIQPLKYLLQIYFYGVPTIPLIPFVRGVIRVFLMIVRLISAELLALIISLFAKKELSNLMKPRPDSSEEWLAQIIKQWHPDIIHTIGLEPSSYFYLYTRQKYKLENIGKWVVKAYGGPDLALHRLIPKYSDKIMGVVKNCDQFIADNMLNYHYAVEMGLEEKKICPLGILPGTGGVDIDSMAMKWKGNPSQRQRILLWPKAYECPASKGIQVLEAIRIAWEKIKPCEVIMTAVTQDEFYYWFQTLPNEIKIHCHLYSRLPRVELIEYMSKARVVLGVSLSDGIPNTLYEAMALGTFPVFSPLDTICNIVENEKNVLFARNLYPEEIATALIRAMNDDTLVDSAVKRNLEIIRKLADRNTIRPNVIEYYFSLCM